MQLSLLPGTVSAPTLWSWLLQNGITGSVWATVLPLLILVPAILLLWTRVADASSRVPIALALGPVGVALALSYRQISWWSGVDTALLLLLVATAAALARISKPLLKRTLTIFLALATVLAGAFGIGQLWPSAEAHLKEGLTRTEVVGLIERDLAYWLAKHVGAAGGVALAPPNVSATLYYYGGIRGLATLDNWDNWTRPPGGGAHRERHDAEEAQELIGLHGVIGIIIRFWIRTWAPTPRSAGAS